MKIFFLSLLFLTGVACSGAKKQTQSDVPMHQPPTNDKVIMPKGAPMIAAEIPAPAVGEDGALIVSQADFQMFLDQGPAYAFTHFDFEPKKNGTVMEGYKITKIAAQASPYVGDALLVEDIVTHVNGMPIGTPDQYFSAWKSLNKSSKIRIDFIRTNVAQHFIWVVGAPNAKGIAPVKKSDAPDPTAEPIAE